MRPNIFLLLSGATNIAKVKVCYSKFVKVYVILNSYIKSYNIRHTLTLLRIIINLYRNIVYCCIYKSEQFSDYLLRLAH